LRVLLSFYSFDFSDLLIQNKGSLLARRCSTLSFHVKHKRETSVFPTHEQFRAFKKALDAIANGEGEGLFS